MIPWALWATVASADPVFGLDRVDVLSEDPGFWLADEAPRMSYATPTSAIRFVEQIKLAWFLPVDGLTVGTSLASQSVVYERRALILRRGKLTTGLLVSGGVQAKAGLPRGLMGGVALRHGRVRIGLSVNAVSSASWSRPDWSVWRALPGAGIGIGRVWAPDRAPWMR